jgi:hypothetical protein
MHNSASYRLCFKSINEGDFFYSLNAFLTGAGRECRTLRRRRTASG